MICAETSTIPRPALNAGRETNPTEPHPPQTREFKLGNLTATLYLGDCLQIMPTLKGIDAVITDPPYGIGFQHSGGGTAFPGLAKTGPIIGDDKPFDPSPILDTFHKPSPKFSSRIPIVLFGANYYSNRLPSGQWLVWDKACGQGAHSNFCDTEFAWTNRKTPRTIYHHMWLGFIRSGEGKKEPRHHVSQKPVELMMWCMETTRVGLGKTVIDPYMGSGSTGIACLRTGRNFIGIELAPTHYASACTRLERELLHRK